MKIIDSDDYIQGIKNLNKICPNFIFKDWCFETSIGEEHINNLLYWSSKAICHDNYKVPVKNIVRTDHSRYSNKNWIEVLGALKKIHLSDWNKSTFLDLYDGPTITFHKYGDQYIIIGGGNNRVCIAKFFEIENIFCKVTEYIFDEDLFQIFNKLKKRKLFPLEDKNLRESPIKLEINKNEPLWT